MIDPGQLYDFFLQQQVNFYTGVPDSLLKHFIKYVEDKSPADQHIITANEGLALSLATGYYLQTAGLPLIYLQNSGLGMMRSSRCCTTTSISRTWSGLAGVRVKEWWRCRAEFHFTPDCFFPDWILRSFPGQFSFRARPERRAWRSFP